MKYCQSCLLPDTRPNLVIDENGVCNACRHHTHVKQKINWDEREKQFQQVVLNAKNRSKGYDCLIPVSGGKDSTWQVVKCLEYGMNPLAVTWKTPARTPVGQENLDNLVRLGVDHIDFQVNPKVEAKFMYQSLVKYGTTALPMHMALFNIPLTLAVKYEIPLVVWGENSADEYGGTDAEKGFLLNSAWLKKYGVTHGTTAEDWVSDSLTRKELTPYFGVSDQELEQKGIRAVFLGYYFEWDVENSLNIAAQHGFKRRTEGAKVGYYDYTDIDCDFIAIHHYIKWYKFGFTRLFDNLSLEIRNGRMNRNEALEILKKLKDQKPVEDIQKFCNFAGISESHFYDILETFRNQEIWHQENGTWKINDFIISDWDWA